MEESIGTDTFAKYFQKDLPIRCQNFSKKDYFRQKIKKISMFCIKDAEELIATKIETNEEIYLEKTS